MFLKELYIAKLIATHLQGDITEEQSRQLQEWIRDDPENEKHFNEAYQQYILQEKLKVYESADRDTLWRKTKEKIIANGDELISRKIIKIFPWNWGAAAALFIALTIGIIVYYQQRNVGVDTKQAVIHDIAPGEQTATLTLANGQKIELSDAANGKIADESGVSITKSSDGQLVYQITDSGAPIDKENVLSTKKGQTYQLMLPDGSKVWLNAGSSLSYTPKLITAGKRKVKLSGEAYFEIVKNKRYPFIVESASQTVEVLGTHFNVNAYTDEPFVGTTLLEGSVKITVGGKQTIIKPGQQAQTKANHLDVVQIDVDNVVDWKDGDFFLNHVNFKIAMRKISRWYNINVIYDGDVPDDLEAGGWISRDKPLSVVLKSIETSRLVQFRIEGQNVYVSRRKK